MPESLWALLDKLEKGTVALQQQFKAAEEDQGGGRWVTIGAQEETGEDGETRKTGGTPVYIKDGRITKGPDHMIGHSPDNLPKKREAAPAAPAAPAPKPAAEDRPVGRGPVSLKPEPKPVVQEDRDRSRAIMDRAKAIRTENPGMSREQAIGRAAREWKEKQGQQQPAQQPAAEAAPADPGVASLKAAIEKHGPAPEAEAKPAVEPAANGESTAEGDLLNRAMAEESRRASRMTPAEVLLMARSGRRVAFDGLPGHGSFKGTIIRVSRGQIAVLPDGTPDRGDPLEYAVWLSPAEMADYMVRPKTSVPNQTTTPQPAPAEEPPPPAPEPPSAPATSATEGEKGEVPASKAPHEMSREEYISQSVPVTTKHRGKLSESYQPLRDVIANNNPGQSEEGIMAIIDGRRRNDIQRAIAEGKIDSHPDYPELGKKAEAQPPHEMSREEYWRQTQLDDADIRTRESRHVSYTQSESDALHRKEVQQAIAAGKIDSHPDYPELGKQAPAEKADRRPLAKRPAVAPEYTYPSGSKDAEVQRALQERQELLEEAAGSDHGGDTQHYRDRLAEVDKYLGHLGYDAKAQGLPTLDRHMEAEQMRGEYREAAEARQQTRGTEVETPAEEPAAAAQPQAQPAGGEPDDVPRAAEAAQPTAEPEKPARPAGMPELPAYTRTTDAASLPALQEEMERLESEQSKAYDRYRRAKEEAEHSERNGLKKAAADRRKADKLEAEHRAASDAADEARNRVHRVKVDDASTSSDPIVSMVAVAKHGKHYKNNYGMQYEPSTELGKKVDAYLREQFKDRVQPDEVQAAIDSLFGQSLHEKQNGQKMIDWAAKVASWPRKQKALQDEFEEIEYADKYQKDRDRNSLYNRHRYASDEEEMREFIDQKKAEAAEGIKAAKAEKEAKQQKQAKQTEEGIEAAMAAASAAPQGLTEKRFVESLVRAGLYEHESHQRVLDELKKRGVIEFKKHGKDNRMHAKGAKPAKPEPNRPITEKEHLDAIEAGKKQGEAKLAELDAQPAPTPDMPTSELLGKLEEGTRKMAEAEPSILDPNPEQEALYEKARRVMAGTKREPWQMMPGEYNQQVERRAQEMIRQGIGPVIARERAQQEHGGSHEQHVARARAAGKTIPPQIEKWYADQPPTISHAEPATGGERLPPRPFESGGETDKPPKKPAGRSGIEFVRAKAGGEVSPVDGKTYRGGTWMPIHGKYSGQERAPKGDGTAEPKSPAEEPNREYVKPRELTPEEVEERRQREAHRERVREIKASPLGNMLRWPEDREGVMLPSDSVAALNPWRDFVEQIGEEKTKELIAKLEPMADKEALAYQRKWFAPDNQKYLPKKHQKAYPSSIDAHAVLTTVLRHAGPEEFHQVAKIMSEMTAPADEASRKLIEQAKAAGYIPNRYPGHTADGRRVPAGAGFVKRNAAGAWETHHADDVRKAVQPPEADGPAPEPAVPTPPAPAGGGEAKPEEPAPAKPAEKPATPETHLARHQAFLDKLTSGTVTPDDLRASYEQTKANEEAIKAELNKIPLDRLSRSMMHRPRNKAEAVEHVYRSLLNDHNVTGHLTYSPFGGGERKALDEKIGTITAEHLASHAQERQAAKAAREERIAGIKKAITNPETADDFRTLIRYKGESALSPEQRTKWDEIQADERRAADAAKRQQSAVVGQVDTGGIGMEIKEGWHDKKNRATYVAVLNQRVDRAKYDELNAAAKKLGGYYSAFKGGRAIPGFQFDTREAAEKFKSILSGDVDRSAEMQQAAEGRQQSASDRLRATAAGMRQKAEASLGADRLTNTARRAEHAANAEAGARSEIAHAKTMEAIADGLAEGKLKHLGGIRARTHLDELEASLRRGMYIAQQKRLKDDPSAYHDDYWKQEPDAGAIDHVEYPYPKLWSGELAKYGKALAEIPGLKQIGKRLAGADAGPEFRKQGNTFKFNGGRIIDPKSIQGLHMIGHGDKHVRVHVSHDWRLSQQGHGYGPFYTADAGKSFSLSPEAAIATAANRGNPLDLVDPPADKLVTIDDPVEIEAVATAASRLKRHPDYNLRSIGERLAGQVEAFHRMQAMDIKTPAELRAALREYMPLKAAKDREDPVKAKERALIGKNIPGFFPTPRPIIDRMLDAAGIEPGHTVLEPSAGKGDILDALRERHPEAKAEALEMHSDLRDILAAKGHNVVGSDAMAHAGQYDRVLMNPPFENGQDIDHVRQAFAQLKPGGRLVAIMSEGPFFRQDGKAAQFREWLEGLGGESEPIQGGFAGKEAFRQTGVNTRLVTIEKPMSEQTFSALLSNLESLNRQLMAIA